MTGAIFHGGDWRWVPAGTNYLPITWSFPPLAASFPWGKAVLLFLPAMVVVMLFCRVFNIHTDTPQGSSIWLPSAILLTLALLWLFGFIPGATVRHSLYWGLAGLAGLFAVSLLLSLIVWLQERKSKRSKDINGK